MPGEGNKKTFGLHLKSGEAVYENKLMYDFKIQVGWLETIGICYKKGKIFIYKNGLLLNPMCTKEKVKELEKLNKKRSSINFILLFSRGKVIEKRDEK